IIDFGTVDTAKFSEALATILNVGTGPITVNAISVSASAAGPPFSVRPQPAPPFVVAGVQTGTLTVTLADGALDSVSLIGNGTAPASEVWGMPNRSSALSIIPNPVNAEAECQLTLPNSGSIAIAVFSADGREVMQGPARFVPAGRSTIPLDLGSLASGHYFLRVHVDPQQEKGSEEIVLPFVVEH